MFWNQPLSSSRFTRILPSSASTAMMMVACGMPEKLGHDDAGLPVAQVVGLKAGQDQVRLLGADGFGKQAGKPSESHDETCSSSM